MHVRPAEARDVAGLVSIWSQMMSEHQRRDQRFALAADAALRWQELARSAIQRRDSFLLVAELALPTNHTRPPQGRGQPAVPDPSQAEQAAAALCAAGFCIGWSARNPAIYAERRIGFVSELAVHREHRRCGVGTALLEAVEHWFKSRDLREYQLSTAVWNTSAQKLWERRGGQPLLTRYQIKLTDVG